MAIALTSDKISIRWKLCSYFIIFSVLLLLVLAVVGAVVEVLLSAVLAALVVLAILVVLVVGIILHDSHLTADSMPRSAIFLFILQKIF